MELNVQNFVRVHVFVSNSVTVGLGHADAAVTICTVSEKCQSHDELQSRSRRLLLSESMVKVK